MQSKGAIRILAIVIALACLYQLSFTWATKHQEKKAVEFLPERRNFPFGRVFRRSRTTYGIQTCLPRIFWGRAMHWSAGMSPALLAAFPLFWISPRTALPVKHRRCAGVLQEQAQDMCKYRCNALR